MKATHIGKTIIIWDKLEDNEISKVLQTLMDIIQNCRNLGISKLKHKIIPIIPTGKKQYLCIVEKHKELIISTTRYKNEDFTYSYDFSAVVNADDLYEFLDILNNSYYDIKDHIETMQKCPDSIWIAMPLSKALETYSLSPNMNPEDFIENLEKGNLTNIQKTFLKNVGFALENQNFTQDLQETIDDANKLFDER